MLGKYPHVLLSGLLVVLLSLLLFLLIAPSFSRCIFTLSELSGIGIP
jgi:hypothetical protein